MLGLNIWFSHQVRLISPWIACDLPPHALKKHTQKGGWKSTKASQISSLFLTRTYCTRFDGVYNPLMIPVPRIPMINEPLRSSDKWVIPLHATPKNPATKKNRTLRMYTSLSRSCVATWMPCFRRWKISTPFGYLDQGWYPSFLGGSRDLGVFWGPLLGLPILKWNETTSTTLLVAVRVRQRCNA